MKVAYIAGPYRDKTRAGIEANIKAAENVAIKYWKKSYAVICPHKNSAHLDGICPDEDFLNAGIEILKRCDTIIMMKNWHNSEGAKRELTEASKSGLEILFDEDIK